VLVGEDQAFLLRQCHRVVFAPVVEVLEIAFGICMHGLAVYQNP
jgi:hypothetical protein